MVNDHQFGLKFGSELFDLLNFARADKGGWVPGWQGLRDGRNDRSASCGNKLLKF